MLTTFFTAVLALLPRPAENDCRTPIVGVPVAECRHDLKPPDDAEVLRCLPRPAAQVPGLWEETRDDVQIVTERLVDRADEPRFFPLVGVARLHHVHWKCTVYYRRTVESGFPFPFKVSGPVAQVVYIDKDHLHLEHGSGAD
jgi:hypothetical protein